MHGLLVRVDVKGDPAEYEAMLTDYANALNERNGFIMKTWVTSGSMVGGFYIFTDRESAQSYIDEMLQPTADQYDVFSVDDVEHFTILDQFSVINNSPITMAAADATPAALD